MSCSAGPMGITNGLILDLDIANRKSFVESAGTPSLINTSTWTVGTGPVTNYPVNGLTTESQRLVDTDPWGNQNIVWQTNPSGDSSGDGGWEGTMFSIDPTKLYRYSVWIRRSSATSGGNFYFGLHTNGTGDVYNLPDGLSQTNPYWSYGGTGSLTQNQWYLFVGHIFPSSWTGTTANADSGMYSAGSPVKSAILGGNIVDCKFPSNATTAMQRVYHYYCGDTTTHLQFAYPRVDLVDGNQPTIAELVSDSPGMLRDTSGYGNHHTLGGYYIPYSSSPTKFTLDGSTQGFVRNTTLNGATAACSIVVWYSTTDIQELWVEGQTTSYYISASNNNNYYIGPVNSGFTNYVDLNVVTNPYAAGLKNGAYHMWEVKGIDFTGWTAFNWFLYPGGWQMAGNISKIQVYNRILSSAESAQIYNEFRGRYGI